MDDLDDAMSQTGRRECPRCEGTGTEWGMGGEHRCPDCGGTGRLESDGSGGRDRGPGGHSAGVRPAGQVAETLGTPNAPAGPVRGRGAAGAAGALLAACRIALGLLREHGEPEDSEVVETLREAVEAVEGPTGPG